MKYHVLELTEAGKPLVLAERAKAEPGPGQVRLRMLAAALNHRDLWIWTGKYANVQYPAVLGSDGCGKVEAVGTGVAESLIGRRVVVNPSLDWGDDDKAAGPAWRILGMPDEGTFAERLTLSANQVHFAPEHLDDSEAAALPLSALTGWRALNRRGGLKAGERVLLTGIGGGVAQWMLAFAVSMQAEVWVTSGNVDKLERATLAGAKGGAVYHQKDWEVELSKQADGGFDLIVDSAGGADFTKLVDLLKPGGRLVFFGATQGNVPDLPLRKVYWRQLELRGTTMGSPRDFGDMLAAVTRWRLRPTIDQVLDWREASSALRRMEAGEQYGKIVLRIS